MTSSRRGPFGLKVIERGYSHHREILQRLTGLGVNIRDALQKLLKSHARFEFERADCLNTNDGRGRKPGVFPC